MGLVNNVLTMKEAKEMDLSAGQIVAQANKFY